MQPFPLPERLIRERFITSPGPGGQNANKVATSVQLRFDTTRFDLLDATARKRLKQIAGSLLLADGTILIRCSSYRTRERNRIEARRRLYKLLQQALEKPLRRIPTSIPAGVLEARKRSRIRRSRAIALRRAPVPHR